MSSPRLAASVCLWSGVDSKNTEARKGQLGLLYCHALRQIARFIDVAAAEHGDVIGKELQRYGSHDRLQEVLDLGNLDHVVGQLGHPRVSLVDYGDHRPAAGFD